MISVLMQVEGVLAGTQSESLVENTPITEGMMLYRALKSIGQIIMYSAHPEDKVRYWLQRERLDDPLYFHSSTELGVGSMITKSRAAGHDLTIMVSADPAHVKRAYRMGLQSLLFVHPSFGRPEWRPDHDDGIRPWGDMVEEIEEHRVKTLVEVFAEEEANREHSTQS